MHNFGNIENLNIKKITLEQFDELCNLYVKCRNAKKKSKHIEKILFEWAKTSRHLKRDVPCWLDTEPNRKLARAMVFCAAHTTGAARDSYRWAAYRFMSAAMGDSNVTNG